MQGGEGGGSAKDMERVGFPGSGSTLRFMIGNPSRHVPGTSVGAGDVPLLGAGAGA